MSEDIKFFGLQFLPTHFFTYIDIDFFSDNTCKYHNLQFIEHLFCFSWKHDALSVCSFSPFGYWVLFISVYRSYYFEKLESVYWIIVIFRGFEPLTMINLGFRGNIYCMKENTLLNVLIFLIGWYEVILYPFILPSYVFIIVFGNVLKELMSNVYDQLIWELILATLVIGTWHRFLIFKKKLEK